VVLKSDGTLDLRFGRVGSIVPDFSPVDFALQPDGNIVITGTTTVAGHTFFAVARYLTTGGSSLTPNQMFIAHVYPDLVERPADPTGLAFWSGMLDRGGSRAQVVQQMETSQEYHSVVVHDLYLQVLGRIPDPSGNTAWTNFLNNGRTAEQLEAYLLGSDEFFSKLGGGNNAGFLQATYQVVLHRAIDPSGALSWGQALAAGISRTVVVTDILASLESDRLETQGLYANLLHRPADPSGLDAYSNLLQQGVPNETIVAIQIGSDEYFAKI
jgi:hypothetical protein